MYPYGMPAQSAQSHASTDPLWHFFLVPIVLINLGLALYVTIHEWPLHSRSHLWWCVMSVAFAVVVLLLRSYPLKVQDRVIRLEERLRYTALLSPADLAASHALSLRQVIALRFASDAELPQLVRRALAESLDPRQIKAAITSWRPDHHRV